LTPKIVAIVATRNEEEHIANCLRQLVRNGISVAVIDNDSEDATLEIVRSEEFAPHVVAVTNLPFEGAFNLDVQLRAKQQLIDALDSDWIVHLDADEELHSYVEGEPLCDTIAKADAEGYNVVNFDEFVFLPLECEYERDVDGHQPILSYYFFEPWRNLFMRAWKLGCGLSMTIGGHRVEGPDLRLSPITGALRHYIFRSQEHAYSKFAGRTFDAEEIARGMHANRIGQPHENFRFPPAATLCRLSSPASRVFDKRFPWVKHYWQWQRLPCTMEAAVDRSA